MSNLRLALVIDAQDNSPGVFQAFEQRAGKVASAVQERFEKISSISEGISRGIASLGVGVGFGLEARDAIEDAERLEHIGVMAGVAGDHVERFKRRVYSAAADAKIGSDELFNAWEQGAAHTGGSLNVFIDNAETLATQIQIASGHGADLGMMLGQLEKNGITAPDAIAKSFATMRMQIRGSGLELAEVAPRFGSFLKSYATVGHEGPDAANEIGAVLGTLGNTAGRGREAMGDLNALLAILNNATQADALTIATGVQVYSDREHHKTRSLPDIIGDLGKASATPGLDRGVERVLGPALQRGLADVFLEQRKGVGGGDLARRLAMRGDPEADREAAHDLGDSPVGALNAVQAKVKEIGVDIIAATKPVWTFIGAHSALTASAGLATASITGLGWGIRLLKFGLSPAIAVASSLRLGIADLAMWTGVKLVGAFPRAGEAAFKFGEILTTGLGRAVFYVARSALPLLVGAFDGAVAAIGTAVTALGVIIEATPIGWILTGIAAIAGGAYLLYKNWSPIKKWWHDLWDGAGEDFDRFRGKITGPIDPNSAMGRIAAAGRHGGLGNSLVAGIYTHLTKPGSAEQQKREKEAFDYFKSQGWSDVASIALSQAARRESSFNERAIGDGGSAYGIWQDHPDRQKAIHDHFGKRLDQMSFREQLEAGNWELREGNEKGAGDALAKAGSLADANGVVVHKWLRSKNQDNDIAIQNASAADFMRRLGQSNTRETSKVTLTVSGLPAGAKATASSDNSEVELGLGQHMAQAQ